MGRFHRHEDGSVHDHDHDHLEHDHDYLEPTTSADVGDHRGYQTGSERIMVLERIFA